MSCANCDCRPAAPAPRRRWWLWLALAVLAGWGAAACNYSFTGVTLPEDVRTFSVELFQNNAPLNRPTLAQEMTQAVRDKFQSQSRLRILPNNGDLRVSGVITEYYVIPAALTAGEQAAQNRLTVRVRVNFVNVRHPEDSWDNTFEQFVDFPAATSLTAVEQQLNAELNDRVAQDIFNKALSNW